ncbi:uncharacterized protein F4812DRAFT_439359 [Daldinia caldariorum]|uniref:uncharacterized protein n=1 Tax=Daldinia caldariorum TaxID=326644 RepID=UPI002007BC16|nr:uncharacterized protein F4812DRAFT_439359 [Daldinia caldariorum]KAI1465052.1 hypothetical protein F4812DRAFT_439359 [Daldinia caldariorum]
MDTSPSKRRVLGSIELNSRSPISASKHLELKEKAISPSRSTIDDSIKRPLELDPEVAGQRQGHTLILPAKKPRLSVGEGEKELEKTVTDEERHAERDSPREDEEEDGVERRRSKSKSAEEESLLLDNSGINSTQETAVTEPDTELTEPAGTAPATPPAPSRRRSTMTREEARQKAETLRLRLGLASYKVRTGQTDVSLEQLEAKSLLRSRQPKEPTLPRLLLWATSTGEEERADKTPSSGRKALPTAPSLSRDSSFEKGRSGTERRQLPGIPIPWPDSRRASR